MLYLLREDVNDLGGDGRAIMGGQEGPEVRTGDGSHACS
jgi:hypothetical protein